MTLGGCQTAAEVQQAQQVQMESVVGLTMAEFSVRTGLTPSDAYAVAGGRVFVVLGRTVTLVTPGSYGAPTVANAQTCRILLEARPIGTQGSASSWQIAGVTWTGPCVGIY
jgi:hypothetical protein